MKANKCYDTDLNNPCSNCKNRVKEPCSWCIEHDFRFGRFEQGISKLNVLDDESKKFVIDWIEHCRYATEIELKNLTNGLIEIYKKLKG